MRVELFGERDQILADLPQASAAGFKHHRLPLAWG
jgi:hypothetical protein